ncbi:MAG: polyprenyl synthetase family protein [Elusimicrobiota bacterium]|jgi:geranylgeranyl diphosphate synthase type II|nr:polyprenyl synthetase family protein [Elusimicrobiota bacterium]
MKNFETLLSQKAKEIEKALKKQISLIKNTPQIIRDSMAYSLEAGGKRVRPALVCWAAQAFGLKSADVMPAACAVEMIHTYSLIHDDLPSMDNDALRRGKPTNHKIFEEDLALLAGDGLLTCAFETLARCGAKKSVGAGNALKACAALAHYAGASGMVGGQVADIFAEGLLEGKSKRAAKLAPLKYFKNKKPAYYLLPAEAKEVSAAQILKYIHENKTGALITASVETGALLAGAAGANLQNIRRYARAIGFAFQVVDDILDVTATKKQLGKTNSDAANKKLTYVSLYGLEESKKAAQKALKDALAALKVKNKEKLLPLQMTAEFIVNRSH